jgi:cytochrome c1
MPDLFPEGDPQADEEVAALVAYLQSLGDTGQRAGKAERP